MPSNSEQEQERERLKEEYKDHYRQIREAKEKLRRSKYVKNVSDAMQQMNADDLLSSVDEFLGTVRNKMSHFEARLDVAMDQFMDEKPDDSELDEALKKEKARDTLKEIKREMGMLYSEIEQQANDLNVEKTVGKKDAPESTESE
ncbi:MAG: hypothetical protein EA390_05785 [Balneolaceae bacterium]|nr:MAG: hypothetical protein EA390_05785 [Balneolaceae bacterium]